MLPVVLKSGGGAKEVTGVPGERAYICKYICKACFLTLARTMDGQRTEQLELIFFSLL